MTVKEIKQFITDNADRIDQSDAYFIQYQQAITVYEAIESDINNGSHSAATDLMIFTIGNKALPIGCWNAETISSIDQMLVEIMENAINNIYLD